jgi:hypothetical protein
LKIKRCRKCGKQFISRTEVCPFCSSPNKRRLIRLKSIWLISVAAFLSIFVSYFFTEKSKEGADLANKDIPSLKEDRNSSDFHSNIDQHYRQLVDSYNAENFNSAIKEIKLFRKYDRIGYRDVEQIKKKLIAYLDQKVRSVPISEILKNLKMYQQLLELDPDNSRYKIKVRFYKRKYENYR